jgi:hypothetical protein
MMIDNDECGALGGMIVKGNGSNRIKPAPLPLFPPQNPHDLNRARTRIPSVESWQLTA